MKLFSKMAKSRINSNSKSQTSEIRSNLSKFDRSKSKSKNRVSCLRLKRSLSRHEQLTKVMVDKVSTGMGPDKTITNKSKPSKKSKRKPKLVSSEFNSSKMTKSSIQSKSLIRMSSSKPNFALSQGSKPQENGKKDQKFSKPTISVTAVESTYIGKIACFKRLFRKIPPLFLIKNISNATREYLLECNQILLSILTCLGMIKLCWVFIFFVFFNWYVELLQGDRILYCLVIGMMISLIIVIGFLMFAIYISRKCQYVVFVTSIWKSFKQNF